MSLLTNILKIKTYLATSCCFLTTKVVDTSLPDIESITNVHLIIFYATSLFFMLAARWPRHPPCPSLHTPFAFLHPAASDDLPCHGACAISPVKPLTSFGSLTHHLDQSNEFQMKNILITWQCWGLGQFLMYLFPSGLFIGYPI